MRRSLGRIAGEAVIAIRGARAHNLRNVDVDLPRGHFVVITGPSGSGKSSLAFDTLFAEGQRQYIESLSVYARQFLHQLERPDVDGVEGLQPTICIDQRPGNQNPRSTVATVTEIYDYLRLLWARLGEPRCYACGAPILAQTPEQIQERLMDLPEGTKAMILAPLVRGKRGRHAEVVQRVRKAGLVRLRVNGELLDIDDFPDLSPRRQHQIDAVVDRVVVRAATRNRVGESLRLALKHGDGLVRLVYLDESASSTEWREEFFSSKYACAPCGISYSELEPRTFSFNSPYGACRECDGLGARVQFDPELVIPDLSLSLNDGAVVPWKRLTPARLRRVEEEAEAFLQTRNEDLDTPLDAMKPATRRQLISGGGPGKRPFPGLLAQLEREFASTTNTRRLGQLQAFRGKVPCPACEGARLCPAARHVYLGGESVPAVASRSVDDALAFFTGLEWSERDEQIAEPLVGEIERRLQFLQRVGVGYLTLNRAADTLSGGELQRVRLATAIGSGLVGVCYVLDEPSIGLHPRDHQRLIEALRDLQRQGNSVVIVEHDEATMRAADQLVDMGPGAGSLGGRVVAQGTPDEVQAHPESLTGLYLSQRRRIEVGKRRRVSKRRAVTIEGVATNNLKGIDVRIPLEVLVCVTGVSGSGKSSLVQETLVPALVRRLGGSSVRPGPYRSLRGVQQLDRVIEIDQAPIGRTPRSNAATYLGLFDEVRKVFAATRDARQRGFGSGRFSFNNQGGRCSECQGQGVKKIEMNFLPDLYVTCSACNGARFNRQTLQVQYRGKTIADVLNMAVSEAVTFFENYAAIHRQLQGLMDVGLGYLPLGQPSTTLSGGEAQRIKLAAQLSRQDTGKTMYVLDEPTTGLHFDDVRLLLQVLQRLVDRKNSVLVIEHHLDVVKCADWIIDLGPEGGAEGGHLLVAGTPEEVASTPENATGRFLKKAVLAAAGESGRE